MLEDYDVSWLLYYGLYRPGLKDGALQLRRGRAWKSYKLGKRAVPYGYVESFLLTLTSAGLHVKHVADAREAAAWLGVLHRWWSKSWSQHRGLRTFDQSRDVSLMPGMDSHTHLRARVAAQLPGVGFERAVAAANHFGSVRELINAGPADWEGVPGIGKVIARVVKEAVE
jgi:ERCC4-type nuclease